jgi:predicted RNA binding protein YcfA (HicA-like mRNA interferase family)
MSVARRELIRYLRANGFKLVREGGERSIYSSGEVVIPVK